MINILKSGMFVRMNGWSIYLNLEPMPAMVGFLMCITLPSLSKRSNFKTTCFKTLACVLHSWHCYRAPNSNFFFLLLFFSWSLSFPFINAHNLWVNVSDFWKWLLTWEMASPLTSSIWRNSFGVAFSGPQSLFNCMKKKVMKIRVHQWCSNCSRRKQEEESIQYSDCFMIIQSSRSTDSWTPQFRFCKFVPEGNIHQ